MTHFKSNHLLRIRRGQRRSVLFPVLILLASQMSWAATPQLQTTSYWPTKSWRASAPEQQGIDSTKLADALDYVRQHDIKIHSLLLIRNGYVILDAYFYPYDEHSVHDLASVTKSVTSTLVGIAIDQGKIKSVREHMPEIFPQRVIANRDARKEKLDVESLLTMSSGLRCQAEDNELTLHQMMESKDWVQFMLDLPMAVEPGSKFVYCSGGMHLLSGIISQATGMGALEFARRSLFEPLGIQAASWPDGPHGINHGWGDLHLRARDMARIGYLWLNHGVWDGKQIVSGDWVTQSTQVHIQTGGDSDYGYGWWVRPKDKLYEAVGRGGQRITVLPELNIVAVETGGGFEPAEVGALLVQAIKSDKALPENRAGVARLAAAVKAGTRPPEAKPIPPLPQMAAKISGKIFVMEPNAIGLQEISLEFPRAEGLARLTFTDGRKEVRPIGLDGVPRISPGGRLGLPVAVKGWWQSDQTFVLDYDEVANINDYQLNFNFHENEITVEVSERTANVKMGFKGTAKR